MRISEILKKKLNYYMSHNKLSIISLHDLIFQVDDLMENFMNIFFNRHINKLNYQ